MRYPQTFIDDLRRQADIVRVVQDYVTLKKKGANWMACCPFHNEKTPSFSVSPTKEIFYCFGCHKGGSVFNFVMEIERVSFPEAIKIVADKTGVPLPKLIDDSRFEARRHEAEEVIELNKWSLEWWEQQLERSSEGRTARDYLDERQVNDETRKTFRLGYAPDSWEALSSYLRQKGATQEQIERSGLVVKKEEGGSYDRFRGRLIVPVMDTQGRPIAFGGRTLKSEDAKYINSPETAAYTKGRNLFGMHLTRDEIRRHGFAILVEGFLDLIVPYQFGVRNIVASLGTAFTPEQAKLLGRFARKVVVNYDGDRAGVNAAKRAIETLLAEDLEVKILVLPDNADPDEFIRKYGLTEYQKHRGEAQPHIQFIIDQAVHGRNLHRPAEKAEAVDEVLPYIRAVKSRLQKREYFDISMDALRISDPALKRELWNSTRMGSESRSVRQKVLGRNDEKPTVAEERLLELMLGDEDLRSIVAPQLRLDDFAELPTAQIFRAILELDREGIEIDYYNLSEKTADDLLAKELLPMLFISDSTHGSQEERDARRVMAERCIETLRLMGMDRRIDELKSELLTAERNGDTDQIDRLVVEQIELTRQRSALLPRMEAAH